MSGRLERVLQDPDVSASQVMEHLGDLASVSLKIFSNLFWNRQALKESLKLTET